ncbi:NAD-binding protein [Actinospica sp. MGRD01-02]|uniref:NAD-binding protein n=1 Tax=Actinospica acidithermotolerans TaxID=2828514 RepID=A0A941INA9_9ACTN|nr:NAD-binding protein [Actinospica acidithermotolerans]
MVVELAEQYEVPVVAIVPSRDADHAPQIVKLLGDGGVVVSPTITEEALSAADAARARGIALVDGDDQGNIHTALRVQALNEDIRVVLRIYNQRLGGHIERLLKNCSVLSRSATAAPAFVNAALRRPNSVRVGDQAVSLEIEERPEREDFLCTIADRIDRQDLTRMRMLPDSPGPAAVWIGRTERQEVVEPGSRAVLRFVDEEPSPTFTRRSRVLWRLIDMIRYFTGVQLRLVLLGSVITVIVSFALIWALARPFAWAVYETLLDLAGSAVPDVYGQPSSAGVGGAWQRVAQVAVTLSGVPLMAVVTAILVENTASRRRAAPRQPSGGIRSHIVVIGLGNVGTRVATLIHDLGIPVVCIERDDNARGILAIQSLDIPVLTGEAPLEHHLRQARVHRSRAVLALTGDDAANLEACLEARAIAPDVRIVLRLFDDDFAAHLYRSFANAASRSVSYLAAPAFAAALMGREVLGTLSVHRHVVLVAEFVVEEGSDLVGRTLRDIDVPGEIRVIAVRSPAARDYLWRPDHGRHIGAGDRYVLLATRSGLGSHTSRVSSLRTTQC